MKFLRKFLDNHGKHYEKGGKLERLFPLYEAIDTVLYTPGKVTSGAPHIRDAINFKRIMMIVIYALVPAIVMGLYNTGYQTNLAIASMGDAVTLGWRAKLLTSLGIGLNPASVISSFMHGLLFFLPLYIVTMLVGGFWEVLFSCIRRHEVAEGFFVTGLLFPLILPPDIPLWQVALGISFGVVIGKEVFGGVGMNIVNPALAGRAFLFFAYPIQISGDSVWVALDGVSRATPLAELADTTMNLSVSWSDAFFGLIPGSIGETSTLACIIGAAFLIVTGIASWRIMVSVLGGMVGFSLLLNFIGSSSNPMFAVTPIWHLVIGGFAFGTVFMATDPVSAAVTKTGKYIYGLLIGFLVVLVRVINPAFPEGMMLAILFGNLVAPLIDKFMINANIKRRALRNVQ